MFRLPSMIEKTFDESKHPRDSGKFSSSPGKQGESKQPQLQPHNERLAALRAQIDAAKRARREAHEELRAHADRHSEEANEHARSAHEDHSNQIVAWVPDGVEDEDPYQEFEESYYELDGLGVEYNSDGTPSERFEQIRDMHIAAKNALEKLEAVQPTGEGEDDFTQAHIDENREHLTHIVKKTKLAARALKEHANRRREMKDVREIKAVTFALPGLVTKARRGFGASILHAAISHLARGGRWEESKHRRGQPGNRGQFASGGGSRSGGSRSSGSKPPPLPKAKPSGKPAQPPGRKYNPRFGKVAHPPSLPGKNTPSMPGTGHPPENIGSPKNEAEAREHFIWLMGRAGILRRQAQGGTPLTPKQTRELTLSVNLANRIHAQHFSDEAQAKKESEAKTGKASDPFGLPTVAERSKPAASSLASSQKPASASKPSQSSAQQGSSGGGKGIQQAISGMGQGVADSLWEHIEDTIKRTGDVPSGERGLGGKKPTYIGQAWDRLKQSGLHTHPEAAKRFVAAMRHAHQYAGARQGKPGADYHKLMGEGIIAGLTQHFGDLINQSPNAKPSEELRSNTTLDDFMNEPPEEKKKPKTNIRHNPDLDAVFGKSAFQLQSLILKKS